MRDVRRFILLLLILYISLTQASHIYAKGEGIDQKNVQIQVTPHDVFSIDNMKPGDWAPRTIEVQNIGSEDFSYNMSVRNDGAEKLFNELLLEVLVESQLLYKGKLKDFKQLSERALTRSTSESMSVTIRFPEHLGNDFQGQEAKFAFLYEARGTYSKDQKEVNGIIDSGNHSQQSGKPVPHTAKNFGQFILIGFCAIVIGVGMNVIRFRRNKVPKMNQ